VLRDEVEVLVESTRDRARLCYRSAGSFQPAA
jgi:hypothetical protein